MIPKRVRAYWPEFEASGNRHGVDPLLVAAVCDRESLCGYALEPAGPAGVGDNGHGRGLMQIDDRFHPAFCGLFLWKDPAKNIDLGAQLLSDSMVLFASEGELQEACAAAAYNAGASRVRGALEALTQPASPEAKLAAIDAVTTHKDYASDVMRRKRNFLLPEVPKSTPPPEKPQ